MTYHQPVDSHKTYSRENSRRAFRIHSIYMNQNLTDSPTCWRKLRKQGERIAWGTAAAVATSSGNSWLQSVASKCTAKCISWSVDLSSHIPHSISKKFGNFTKSWSTNCQPFQLSCWLQLLTQLWCAKLLERRGLRLQETSLIQYIQL